MHRIEGSNPFRSTPTLDSDRIVLSPFYDKPAVGQDSDEPASLGEHALDVFALYD